MKYLNPDLQFGGTPEVWDEDPEKVKRDYARLYLFGGGCLLVFLVGCLGLLLSFIYLILKVLNVL